MKNDAQIALTQGGMFPYELTPGDNLTPPDWAHRAARGVMADLSDRRGIKWELQHIHHDDRKDMVAALAAIIRLAHSEANVKDEGRRTLDLENTNSNL
jgi:hypothetical protein